MNEKFEAAKTALAEWKRRYGDSPASSAVKAILDVVAEHDAAIEHLTAVGQPVDERSISNANDELKNAIARLRKYASMYRDNPHPTWDDDSRAVETVLKTIDALKSRIAAWKRRAETVESDRDAFLSTVEEQRTANATCQQQLQAVSVKLGEAMGEADQLRSRIDDLERRLAGANPAAPTNAELLSLADQYPSPQEWYDEQQPTTHEELLTAERALSDLCEAATEGGSLPRIMPEDVERRRKVIEAGKEAK